MIENRAAPRHKVLKRGSIRFSGGGSIDCTVRNLSSNGAGLDVVTPMGLPQSFTLVIEADQVQDRGMQIVDRADVLDGMHPELVGIERSRQRAPPCDEDERLGALRRHRAVPGGERLQRSAGFFRLRLGGEKMMDELASEEPRGSRDDDALFPRRHDHGLNC